MPEPSILRLKRKATEDAPSVLVLEPRSKRAATNIHYVRKPDQDEALEAQQDVKALPQNSEVVKRVFHLNRKRKGVDESVATFEEKRHKTKEAGDPQSEDEPEFEGPYAAQPLKRPSKRAAVQSTNKLVQSAETEADRKRMEALASYMHQDALKEIKRERAEVDAATLIKPATPPKAVATPKLSGQRSRDLHRQRVATNGSVAHSRDAHAEDENDYVYDTYILASTSDLGATQMEGQSGLGNVGYLVITEEDESLWETYLEDEPSDKDWNSEEEDENAEDYYGADYPEDELESDDEFDRNVYDYGGHGGSDGEEWYEDTGMYSGDDDEMDGVPNPLKQQTNGDMSGGWR